jgi:hypothetical protein
MKKIPAQLPTSSSSASSERASSPSCVASTDTAQSASAAESGTDSYEGMQVGYGQGAHSQGGGRESLLADATQSNLMLPDAHRLSYIKRFGVPVLPRIPPTSVDWEAATREVERLSALALDDTPWYSAPPQNAPGPVCDPGPCHLIFEPELYIDSDAILAEESARRLATLLQYNEPRRPLWFEAMATALTAQGRKHEAAVFYGRLLRARALPDRTLLAVARWGSPTVELPMPAWATVDKEIRNQAFLGAAAAGNVTLMQELVACGADPYHRIEWQTAATVAARFGHLPVLRYLYGPEGAFSLQQEDLEQVADPRESRWTLVLNALGEASMENHWPCMAYLLDIAQAHDVQESDDVCISLDVMLGNALRDAQLETVQGLVRKVPYLASTRCSGPRELRLEELVVYGEDEEKQLKKIEILNFLIDQCGFDINAVDSDGRTMVTIAACNDVRYLEARVRQLSLQALQQAGGASRPRGKRADA